MSSELTFAICAYRDSPYLEEAILSAKRQTIPVEILIATSTPSDYIRGLAEKHRIPLLVNPEKKGIAADWNFALSCVRTPYATIVHQDDIYLPEYAQHICNCFRKFPETIIGFTDYGDLLSDGKIHADRFYLQIKRMLLWSFYIKNVHFSRLWKRTAVTFGNAICCPSVSYHLPRLKDTRFSEAYSVNLDWDMWLRLADRQGAFAFVPKVLMGHRIAGAMETAAAIADHRREKEDLAIFSRIWGKTLAGWFMKLYQRSYKANTSCQ